MKTTPDFHETNLEREKDLKQAAAKIVKADISKVVLPGKRKSSVIKTLKVTKQSSRV
jgi:hypothetical protein